MGQDMELYLYGSRTRHADGLFLIRRVEKPATKRRSTVLTIRPGRPNWLSSGDRRDVQDSYCRHSGMPHRRSPQFCLAGQLLVSGYNVFHCVEASQAGETTVGESE